MNNVTLEKVQKIISEQLFVEVAECHWDAKLVDDLGCDSLDALEIVMAVEEEFDVEISDDDVEKLATVGDFVKWLEAHKV